jgi:hypothetical protein
MHAPFSPAAFSHSHLARSIVYASGHKCGVEDEQTAASVEEPFGVERWTKRLAETGDCCNTCVPFQLAVYCGVRSG